MSKRKENIRKYCDDISAIGMLLKVKTGKVNYDAVGDILIHTAHRIKRTTWRGDESRLDKNITEQIKRIAIRSFENKLTNVNIEGGKK